MSHWLIPELFGPLPRGSDLDRIPRLPHLERILGRAECDPDGGPKTVLEALGHLFGADQDIASGPLSYLGVTRDDGDRWVCLAHPVVLQPDQDRVLLLQPESGVPTRGGLQGLVERFNDHFRDDRLRLECPAQGGCYLIADAHHAVLFEELEAVVGRNIEHFLPRGPDRRFWCSLLNETQMLLHDLLLDEARAPGGLAPVNGLWFSGGGRLPSALKPRIRFAAGLDPVLAGLCRLSDVTLCDVETAIAHNGLVLFDGLSIALSGGGVASWVSELQRLESILTKLSSSTLTIYACNGQAFHYKPSWRNRWRSRLRMDRLLMLDHTP